MNDENDGYIEQERRDSQGEAVKLPVKKRRHDSEGDVRHG